MTSTCCGRNISYTSAFFPKPTNTKIPRFVIIVHLSHRSSHATSHRPSHATSTEGFSFPLTNSPHSIRETQHFLLNFLKDFPFSLKDSPHSTCETQPFLFSNFLKETLHISSAKPNIFFQTF